MATPPAAMPDQADTGGFGRVDPRAGQREAQGVSDADETGEALAGPAAGDDPEVDFRLAQSRSLRCDPDVARHGEFESAAEAVAVDHREDRLRRPIHGVVERAMLVHPPLF